MENVKFELPHHYNYVPLKGLVREGYVVTYCPYEYAKPSKAMLLPVIYTSEDNPDLSFGCLYYWNNGYVTGVYKDLVSHSDLDLYVELDRLWKDYIFDSIYYLKSLTEFFALLMEDMTYSFSGANSDEFNIHITMGMVKVMYSFEKWKINGILDIWKLKER